MCARFDADRCDAAVVTSYIRQDWSKRSANSPEVVCWHEDMRRKISLSSNRYHVGWLFPLVPHRQREYQLQTRHSLSGYGDLHLSNVSSVMIRLSSYAPPPTEIASLVRGKRSALRVSWHRWRVSKKPLMRNSSPTPSSPPLLYCALRFARLRASCHFVPHSL
jgi:hypothetical protein